MATVKSSERSNSTMNVRDIGASLPSVQHPYHRKMNKTAAAMPPTLPECFAEVWRRRGSTLPAHRCERATLEAVASTIPEEARSATGAAAAGVYLAALIMSLKRIVETTRPQTAPASEGSEALPKGKKARKKQRKADRDAEAAVKDMAAPEVFTVGRDDSAKRTDRMVDEENDADSATDSDIELIASLVYLIAQAVRGASQPVLNSQCEHVLGTVMAAQDHTAGKDVVVRHTSVVFSSVLSVLDAVAWSKPAVQRAYLYLLSATWHSEAKARRRARDALEALLRCPRASVILSKTSVSASGQLVSELKLQGAMLDQSIKGDAVVTSLYNSASFIHLLTSAERFTPFLIPQDAARVAKEIVLIVTKNLPNVTVFGLLALGAVFRKKVTAEDDDPQGNKLDPGLVPKSDLGKLLQVLLKHELIGNAPSELVIAYSNCITDGAIAYANSYLHSPPMTDYILKPVQKLFDLMDPTAGRSAQTKSITTDLRRLLSQRWFQSNTEIFSLLKSFTGNVYRMHWPETTLVLKRYLEEGFAAGNPQMKPIILDFIKAIVAMREKAMTANDRKVQEMVRGLLSSIAKGGGAERLLSVIDLSYDKQSHITNPWILPILRENLCGAPLSLFTSHLMPIAEQLEEAAKKTSLQNRVVEAKNTGIYISQIWGLLPGFCNKPSDLGQDGVMTTAFKAIHFCFSTEDFITMYTIGVGGLRQLAASISSLQAEDPTTKAKQKSFGSRLKKLFPTISDVAEKVADDRRGLILEAVVAACRATNDPSLVSALLHKTIRSLLEAQLNESQAGDAMTDEETRTRTQHSIADLAIALAESGIVPRDAAEIGFLEKAMSPLFFDAKHSSLQKKAYRATALLISLGASGTNQEALDSFVKRIAEAGKTVAPGAKASRQALILALINHHVSSTTDDQRMHYLNVMNDYFLSEVILGTRDSSEKTRAASFGTLLSMARAWNMASSEDDMAGLRQFCMAVAAGLGGKTVSMLSATLTSLGRLIYDFQGEASLNSEFGKLVDSMFASKVAPAQKDEIMDTADGAKTDKEVQEFVVQPGPVAILLRHSAIEVQKAALGVMKIATKAIAKPVSRLEDVLPGVLPGLVHAAARSKKQEIRLRVRIILERLLRKCGREVLEENFPPEHMKLLAAVRKQYSRDLIKKHASKERRKEANASQTRMGQGDGNDDANDGGDSDFDLGDSDVERELLDGDDLLNVHKRMSKGGSEELRVAERDGDVMNLLDANNSQSMLTHDDSTNVSRPGGKRKRGGRNDDVIKYSDDGRPIFIESDGDSGAAEGGSIANDVDSDSDMEIRSKARKNPPFNDKKRRRNESENARHTKKMKGSFGEEYRGRRGSGDVKRAGRPDPFAYIPLGASMLGKNTRPGSSKASRGGQVSSLHRINRKGGKKKGRSGVPGKR